MSRAIQSLVYTSWIMAVLTLAFGIALILDPSTVDGVPTWLKPAKFAVSLSIYGFTFAWILRQLPRWPRIVNWAAWATTAASWIELGLIALQAGRGEPSHFNIRTPFDSTVFAIMGMVITAQTLSAGMVALALWCQAFPDRALGWALRLGLTLSILGSSVGGIMVRPTSFQRAEAIANATGNTSRSGSHTVGASDGGPGLPGLRWSTEHGDLRAAHFVGLHAMQVIPLVAFFTRRWNSNRERVAIVAGAASSYGTCFALLLAQALAGQPITKPNGWIRIALVLWAVATATLAAFAWHASRRGVSPDPHSAREVA